MVNRENTSARTYYYRKNLQGDITHIFDENNNLKAQYVYDAWGNCKITYNEDNIANVNPFRYRGYYFDVESGLYYLKSRYYDPETGRFINVDAIEILDAHKEYTNGLNLYSYCFSNPIMHTDPSGYGPIWDWITGAANTVWNGIKSAATAVWNGVTSVVGGAVDWINTSIVQPVGNWLGQNVLNPLGDMSNNIFNTISDGIGDIGYGIVNALMSFGGLNSLQLSLKFGASGGNPDNPLNDFSFNGADLFQKIMGIIMGIGAVAAVVGAVMCVTPVAPVGVIVTAVGMLTVIIGSVILAAYSGFKVGYWR